MEHRNQTAPIAVRFKLRQTGGRETRMGNGSGAGRLREDRAIGGAEAIAECADGTRVPAMAYPAPLHDASGKLLGAANMLVDISDRKRADAVTGRHDDTLEQRVEERTRQLADALEQLRKSERRFRLLVEGVADQAIFMLDPHGCVTDWNSGAERVNGYREDEILGRHFSCFYPPEDQQKELPQHGLTIAARHGSYVTEGWRVRKGGARFWASVVVNAVRDEAGTLIGFAKVTRDMTARRAVEEQLRQAQKMEAVGQLTNGIAHDFNNVLAAIIPNLELAAARINDERAKKCLANAMHAADQGTSLTNQLLAFSRRNDVQSDLVDIGRVIADSCLLLPRTIGPNIAIERVLDGDVWHAVTDRGSLELAILNLAINARDAMPSGGTLTIETGNLPRDSGSLPPDVEPGDYIVIALRDTGCGMSWQVRSQAFEPFFTTKEPGKGTGLGLSMVYGFAKRSGGTVTIESEPGSGTTIRVYLPRARLRLPTPADGSDECDIDGGPPYRILVVDDDDQVRSAIVTLVRSFGHEVVEAASGQDALELLDRDRRFDLLITDFAMPVVHGTELAAIARRRIPGVPTLFVTGDAEAAENGDLTAPARMLKKPFRQSDLAENLRQLLRRKAPSPSPPGFDAPKADMAWQLNNRQRRNDAR
jgi:PAS domain S-box-containing protein